MEQIALMIAINYGLFQKIILILCLTDGPDSLDASHKLWFISKDYLNFMHNRQDRQP